MRITLGLTLAKKLVNGGLILPNVIAVTLSSFFILNVIILTIWNDIQLKYESPVLLWENIYVREKFFKCANVFSV